MKQLLLLLLIPSLILNAILLSREQKTKQDEGVAVLSVYDGDTLILENKERLRLRQVDAPELTYCGGAQAKAALEKLVSDKRVRITEQIPDQQGRGMALVYVDDTLVNKELLAAGLVRFHHDTTMLNEELKAVAEKAKEHKLGIFSSCHSTTNTKCSIKGNIDRQKKTYHLPGCTQYPYTTVEEDIGEAWFCTEKEAQRAGYVKSERCP